MNKKTVVSVMAVAMLFAVSLFFVGGTYARYAGDFTGNATAQIAKWAVQVNGQEEQALNLAFTVAKSDNVVENKIAPSITANAGISVNLAGTETAVELVVEKGEEFSQAITTLGLDEDQITFTIAQKADNKEQVKVEEGGDGSEDSPFVLLLPDQVAFTAENGTLELEVKLTWNNTDNADKNAKDTTVGKTKTELVLPVTLKVQQHIAA